MKPQGQLASIRGYTDEDPDNHPVGERGASPAWETVTMKMEGHVKVGKVQIAAAGDNTEVEVKPKAHQPEVQHHSESQKLCCK